MTWPRTAYDRMDEVAYRDFEDRDPEFARLWHERKICGCGDVLQTKEERRDGVCETCLALGTRTPRPMEVEGDDDA